ncbi:18037_t:CDS:2 [Entrophospora sp. SA101]|nr:4066_t:CDS:2 [Entrophospora sp. SA101]CAJ0768763.1 18037_t:CDS:2 [Entrophospora sp. SA101]
MEESGELDKIKDLERYNFIKRIGEIIFYVELINGGRYFKIQYAAIRNFQKMDNETKLFSAKCPNGPGACTPQIVFDLILMIESF